MKTLLMSLFLLALSCGAPKEKSSNTETEAPIEKKVKEEPKNQLIAVLSNPKSIDNVKALVTNSGLKWKSMVMDSEASKIAVIEIPDGKLDFWIERLNNSNEFRTITANSKDIADKLVKREKNTLVTIRKTMCMGDCPSYDVYIDKEGNVSFKGKEFVLVNGVQEFKLSDKELGTINDILKKKDFKSFKDVYDNPRIMDLPSTFLVHNGKQVKVRLWNDDVPEELMELNEYIEGILLEKKFFE